MPKYESLLRIAQTICWRQLGEWASARYLLTSVDRHYIAQSLLIDNMSDSCHVGAVASMMAHHIWTLLVPDRQPQDSSAILAAGRQRLLDQYCKATAFEELSHGDVSLRRSCQHDCIKGQNP